MTTVPSAASARPGSALDAMLLFTIPFTVIAWASSFPAIRAGLAGFGALELAALRFAIAGVFAALFLIVTRPKLPERADVWRFLTGGIVFIALYAIFLNLGQRVVPADSLPHAAPFRAGAAHRIRQAVRVIDAVEIGPHLGAEPAIRDRMVGIGVEGDRAAILHGRDHRAGIRAIVGAGAANLLNDGQGRHGRLLSLSRLYGVEGGA